MPSPGADHNKRDPEAQADGVATIDTFRFRHRYLTSRVYSRQAATRGFKRGHRSPEVIEKLATLVVVQDEGCLFVPYIGVGVGVGVG